MSKLCCSAKSSTRRVCRAPLKTLRERSQLFFSLLPAQKGGSAFDGRREFLEENGEEYDALNQALRRISAELEQLPQKPEQVFGFARRAQQLQVQLGFVMEDENPNTVFWIERRGFRGAARTRRRHQRTLVPTAASNVFVQATPIEVGPDSARMPVVETGNRGSHLRHPRGRRWLRLHPAASRPGSRARVHRAFAFRLRTAGDPVCAARPARSAHPAIHRPGLRPDPASARNHARPRLRALHQLRADE